MKRKVMKRTALTAVAALSLGLGAVNAPAADMKDVENSFYPYKNGVPTYEGLEAGMTITQANVEQFKEVLDEGMYEFIKRGWTEMKVGETFALTLNQGYIDATVAGLNKVSLGDSPGQINGYVAGRPFPEEPELNDPRAGEKLAWNYKYGYNWGDNAAIYPFYWKFRDLKSGKIERTIKFNFHFLNLKHRVVNDPKPDLPNNPGELFRAIYVQALEPFDVRNTQLLIHRYEDDLKRDDAWLYLGFQRRVRRLSSGQTTDSFLGSDLMIEDFEGYNGRISDMKWTYKGTKNILLPFYKHNELTLSEDHKESDGYQFVEFGGQGGCFPNITWQLRKVYILESQPVDPNHPISKRVHYVDAETFTLPRTVIYDRKGDLWKTFVIGQAHPDYHLPKNKGSGVSIDDSFMMLDVQGEHCTTGQFKGQVDPALNPRSKFTVQNLRVTGK
ncbi:DUF1329 domain-containing protein [Luteithermobacter gelatinilyticus]|uniref:DUF1329 domain-containing protein n=1 Tax=Luteithermobacter gelatinilyticus TaxID=2582913 RepID=UPI001AEFD9D7|nr:DUF1329 domain-containing protein [Luteithermobacter gelatinilyticus]